jgi:hypothetical protein
LHAARAERCFAHRRHHAPYLVVAQDVARADDHAVGKRGFGGPTEVLRARENAQARLRRLSRACAGRQQQSAFSMQQNPIGAGNAATAIPASPIRYQTTANPTDE